ncbi:unnamed protein product [Pieris brassicae]|uniref:Uncharacterized protein n=1 Tax=Pieris brassicae TaxID=7116 RepID=A0A9P0TW74_PIEBR|nr:unnamed protein product [Pieris brassicae]
MMILIGRCYRHTKKWQDCIEGRVYFDRLCWLNHQGVGRNEMSRQLSATDPKDTYILFGMRITLKCHSRQH